MFAGETFVLRTSGGGGLGDPRERDPERIAADIEDGFVGRDAARNDYGAEGIE